MQRPLNVTGLSEDGRGIAELDGKPVLIDGALPAETVTIEDIVHGKHYHRAQLRSILTRSPYRVAPPCPYFGECGGCQLQHLDTPQQLEHKQQHLAEAFRQQAKLQPTRWREPLRATDYAYRRRARLGVRDLPGWGVVLGFHQKDRSYIYDIQSCNVLEPRISDLLSPLHNLISTLDCSRRLPQVEAAAGDEMLALVFRHLVPLTEHDIRALEGFAQQHQVQVFTQHGGPDTVQRLWPQDAAPLYYDLPDFDIRLTFGPTDFIQSNAPMNRRLVNATVEALQPNSDDHVLELFAGLGNFGLPVATRAGRVDAVEGLPHLVERGEHNSRANKIANINWHALDLYNPAEAIQGLFNRANKLLLDPPREGALPALKALPPAGIEGIVYVSCNPKTLARDCAYLVSQQGYTLSELGLVDMFPQTKHAEALAVLQRQ